MSFFSSTLCFSTVFRSFDSYNNDCFYHMINATSQEIVVIISNHIYYCFQYEYLTFFTTLLNFHLCHKYY